VLLTSKEQEAKAEEEEDSSGFKQVYDRRSRKSGKVESTVVARKSGRFFHSAAQ
jgi:hypothetical protein